MAINYVPRRLDLSGLDLEPVVDPSIDKFKKAAGFTFRDDIEGGFTIDNGGPTNYGITQNTLNAYQKKHGLPELNVRDIDPEYSLKIAKEEYYDKPGFDAFPEGTAALAFDFGFNAGPSRSIKIVQDIVGAKADGVNGPKTKKAVADYVAKNGEKTLNQNIADRIKDYYLNITEGEDPKKRRNGYMNRINKQKERLDLSFLNPFYTPEASAEEIPSPYPGLDLEPVDQNTQDPYSGLDLEPVGSPDNVDPGDDLGRLLAQDAAKYPRPYNAEEAEMYKAMALGAAEPFLSRTTDIYKDPDIKSLLEAHPIAKGIGETARDLAALVPIGRLTMGVASLPFVAKIAQGLSEVASVTNVGKKFMNVGEATRYVAKAVHSGATFATLQAVKEATIEKPDENFVKSLVNVSTQGLFGSGLGLFTGAPNYIARAALSGVYGGVTTGIQGGSPLDVALNSALFGGFELINGKAIDRNIKLQALNNMKRAIGEFLIKGGKTPDEAVAMAETALNNSIKNSGGLDNVLDNNTAPFMNQLASEMQKQNPMWSVSKPKTLPDGTPLESGTANQTPPTEPKGPVDTAPDIKKQGTSQAALPTASEPLPPEAPSLSDANAGPVISLPAPQQGDLFKNDTTDANKQPIVETGGVQQGKTGIEKPVTETKSDISAYDLGKKAFLDGKKNIPALDGDLKDLLKGKKTGESGPLLDDWIKGWTEANLADDKGIDKAASILDKYKKSHQYHSITGLRGWLDANHRNNKEYADEYVNVVLLAQKQGIPDTSEPDAKEASDQYGLDLGPVSSSAQIDTPPENNPDDAEISMDTSSRVKGLVKYYEKVPVFEKDPAKLRKEAEAIVGGNAKEYYDELYDSVEMAANKKFRVIAHTASGLKQMVLKARELESSLPLRSRSLETIKNQQFSTPLPLAVAANHLLAAGKGDIIMEPTAGTGNLIVPFWNGSWDLIANELDPRRVEVLKNAGFPLEIVQGDFLSYKGKKPTAIIANPPFGALGTGKYKKFAADYQASNIDQQFIEKMLRLLPDGGRIAVITSMGTGSGASGNPFRRWLEKNHTFMASIASPKEAYKYRGAPTVETALLMIEKGKGRGNVRPLIKESVKDWDEYTDIINKLRATYPRLEILTKPEEKQIIKTEEPKQNETAPAPVKSVGRERAGGYQEVSPRLSDTGGSGGASDQLGDRPAAVRTEQPESGKSIQDDVGQGVPTGGSGSRQEPASGRTSRKRIGSFVEYKRHNVLPVVNPHPSVIVESQELASVSPPNITITPGARLMKAYKDGHISDQQMDVVLLAIQSIKNGKGFLISDDVGVGKTREMAGIILDALDSGKANRVLYVSLSPEILNGHINNDFSTVMSGKPGSPLPYETVRLESFPNLSNQLNIPVVNKAIYTVTQPGMRKHHQRVMEIGFDLIVFDEAHKWHQTDDRTATGIAWERIHKAMTGKPLIYATATPGIDLNSLGYLYGLGEWNKETYDQYLANITGEDVMKAGMFARTSSFASSGSIPLTQQFMREMKMKGLYASRDLARENVKFGVKNVPFTKDDIAQYDKYMEFLTKAYKVGARYARFDKVKGKRSLGLIKSLMQFAAKRHQVDLKVARILDDVKKDIASGKRVFIFTSGLNELDPDAPKGYARAVIDKINEDRVEKLEGEILSEKIPEAIEAKELLLEEFNSFPPQLSIESFVREKLGGQYKVGFYTGNTTNSNKARYLKEWMAGKIDVMLGSDAAKTAISAHDTIGKEIVNYYLDIDFEVTKFKQALGRTNRAGEKSSPTIIIPALGAAGEQKFIATIASRMKSLGATSKGQAESGVTDFLSEFDLDGAIAHQAARNTFNGISDSDKELFLNEMLWESDPQGGRRVRRTAPEGYYVDNFLYDLNFMPYEEGNRMFKNLIENYKHIVETSQTLNELRAERLKGKEIRTIDIFKDEKDPNNYVVMHEVLDESGHRFGILSGMLLDKSKILNKHGIKRFIKFTTPDGILSGKKALPSAMATIAKEFGKDIAETITADNAFEVIMAGDKVTVIGGMELYKRQNGMIGVKGAKMSEKNNLIKAGAAFSPVGSAWMLKEATDQAVKDFIKYYPLSQGDPGAVKETGSGYSSGEQSKESQYLTYLKNLRSSNEYRNDRSYAADIERQIRKMQDSGVSEGGSDYGAKPFYSQLLKVAELKMPNVTSVEQVKGILSDKNGVKKEEYDWLGVDQFLEGKQRVAKQELVDFIKANQVEIIEKELSFNKTVNDPQEEARLLKESDEATVEEANIKESLGLSPRARMFVTGSPAVWHYGEPDGRKIVVPDKYQKALDSINERWARYDEYASPFKDEAPENAPQYDNYQIPGGENYRELLLTLPAPKLPKGVGRPQRVADEREAGVFRSSHFDEPNILAHVRMNDRVDAEGKKVLFIEEVQSDWHQKGRKIGYSSDKAYGVKIVGGNGLRFTYPTKELAEAKVKELNGRTDVTVKYEVFEVPRKGDVVPDAPFKKTWHELALKRMLRYAAENGYDKLAWTTGEQQAERYDLGRQVREINASTEKEGYYDLEIFTKDEQIITRTVDTKSLPDFVGKDLAEKIINSPKIKEGKVETFAGGNLRVGGEGMKGFYDQILPSFMNKYAKKWGGRVGRSDLKMEYVPPGNKGKRVFPDVPVHSIDITPSMRKSVMEEGQSLFERSPGYGKLKSEGDQAYGNRQKESEALRKGLSYARTAGKPVDVQSPGPLSKFAKDFVRDRGVNVTGQSVKTTQEAAQLAALARNPFIENYQVLFVKDDHVVAHQILSSGQPGNVTHPNVYKLIYKLQSTAKRLGVKDIILAHNHPLGDPTPSFDDIRHTRFLTDRLSRAGVQVIEHIVTNGDKFAVINRRLLNHPDGIGFEIRPYDKPFESYSMTIPEKVSITEGAHAANLVRRNRDKEKVSVIFLNNKGYVMHLDTINAKSDTIRYANKMVKAYQARRAIIVYHSDPKVKFFEDAEERVEEVLYLTDRGYKPVWTRYKDAKPVSIYRVSEGEEQYKSSIDAEAKYNSMPPEEKAAFDLEMDNLRKTPEGNLLVAIKKIGGIAPHRSGKLKEEYAQLPLYLKNSKGRPLDEFLGELKQYGWNFDTEDALIQEIKHVIANPVPKVDRASLNKIIREAKKNKALSDAIERRLNGEKERRFIKTVREAANTDPEVARSVEGSYQPISNQASVEEAKAFLASNREDAEFMVWKKGPISRIEATLAGLLLNEYAVQKKHAQAKSLAEHIAVRGTLSGQGVQALYIYERLSPEGMLVMAQNAVRQARSGISKEKLDQFDKLVRALNSADREKLARKLGIPYLSDEFLADLMEMAADIQAMPEGREKLIATAIMLKQIADQMPRSFWRKVSMTQTISQLLNPKTLIRNLFGNIVFFASENISDVVATAIDASIALATKKRTVYLPDIPGQAKSAIRGFREAVQEIHLGINLKNVNNFSQFNISANSVFADKTFMGMLEKWLRYGLGPADRAFWQAAYDQSIKEQLKSSQLIEPTEDQIEKAVMLANYRTFQDDNILSRQFSKIKELFNFGKEFGLGDVIIKYAKTTANLFHRGIEYSPLGFAHTIMRIADPLIFGNDFKQEKFARQTARAFVGTALFVGAGALLAMLGIISGKRAKDQDIVETRKNTGIREYQINMTALKRFLMSGLDPETCKVQENDVLVNYDWIQPAAIGIALGANMVIDPRNSLVDHAVNIADGFASASETLQEQPLMTGIKRFTNQRNWVSSFTSAAQDIPASFVPTVLNQVRQLTDNIARNVQDPDFTREVGNKVLMKVPGASGRIPAKITTLGEESEMYQDGSNNPFNVFLNPAFVSRYKPDPVSKMVLDIWEKTGETSQFPRVPDKMFKPAGAMEPQPIEAEQYVLYAKYIGNKTNVLFTLLQNDPKFMRLDDLDKAKKLSGYLTDIKQAANIEILGVKPARKDKGAQFILKQISDNNAEINKRSPVNNDDIDWW